MLLRQGELAHTPVRHALQQPSPSSSSIHGATCFDLGAARFEACAARGIDALRRALLRRCKHAGDPRNHALLAHQVLKLLLRVHVLQVRLA